MQERVDAGAYRNDENLALIMDMTDKKMSPPTAFIMNRGTKICVAAAMLAPKANIVNNCQNSLRDDLNRFGNFESWSCLWQSFSNSGLIMESSLKKADDKSGYLYDN